MSSFLTHGTFSFVTDSTLIGYHGAMSMQQVIDLGGLCPEMFMANPSASYDPTVNDQPFVQAALTMATSLGRRVFLPRKKYAIWCPLRTSAFTDTYATDGHPLLIQGNTMWESTCGGSDLIFFDLNGANPETSYQLVPYSNDNASPTVWRGGGLYVQGGYGPSFTTNPIIDRVQIRGIRFLGQRLHSVKTQQPYVQGNAGPNPVRTTPPTQTDGWDLSDKGFWLQDTVVNNLLIEDFAFVGWKGEIYYAATTGGTAKLINGKILTGNGDGLNPGGTGRIECYHLEVGDCLQPAEIIGSLQGSKFVDCLFRDADVGISALAGFFAEPDPTLPIPWIEWQRCTFVGAGLMSLSGYQRGDMTCIDGSLPSITASAGGVNAHNMMLDITVITDKQVQSSGLLLYGPPDLATPLYSQENGTSTAYQAPCSGVHIKLKMVRTAHAVANGLYVNFFADCKGLIDPQSCSIIVEDGEYWYSALNSNDVTNSLPAKSAPLIKLLHDNYFNPYSYGQDVKAILSSGSSTVQPFGPVLGLETSNTAGFYAVTLGTTWTFKGNAGLGVSDRLANYPHGQDLHVVHNEAGANAPSFVLTSGDKTTTGMRLQAPTRTLTKYGQRLHLRYSMKDQCWCEVNFQPLQ